MLGKYDAVGHDVIKQRFHLSSIGYSCFVYTESLAKGFDEFTTISEGFFYFLASRKKTVIIYHHAVYWDQGEKILKKLGLPTIIKYHNITPPSFYKNYDSPSLLVTQNGVKQTARLASLPFIRFFVSDSRTNQNDLSSLGVRDSILEVIPPFTKIMSSPTPPSLQMSSVAEHSILFVGRVVPNKGIHHLIMVLKWYIQFYDDNIQLNIVGSFSMQSKKYYRELQNLINENRLGANINFKGQVSYSTLNSYYHKSSAFLICSEHEGFCVPILEAQAAGLPILALGRTAISDTIGQNQLVLEKMDYKVFATALRRLLTDSVFRNYLIENGYKNCAQYKEDILAKETKQLVQTLTTELI